MNRKFLIVALCALFLVLFAHVRWDAGARSHARTRRPSSWSIRPPLRM